jgi:hypothetical protein
LIDWLAAAGPGATGKTLPLQAFTAVWHSDVLQHSITCFFCFKHLNSLDLLLQGQEPLASLEVAQLCSSGAHQQQQQQQQYLLNSSTSSSSSSAAVSSSTQDVSSSSTQACAAADADADADSDLQQQQQQVCGGWSCSRWDGEATVEELSGQQHAGFFWLSVVFLVSEV